ncbi:hypothetical protein [Lutimonas vermicola]|uniref:Uncharacterized protein n=1 Tax=Lutimonas vermicola TaxID=414288 RepID=A0ABU9KZY3_9FLAO
MQIFKHSGFHPRISSNTVHAITIFGLVENKRGIYVVSSSLQLGNQKNIKLIELDQIPHRTVLSVTWNSVNENPILNKISSKIIN